MLFGSYPFKFLHKTLRGIKSFVSGCGCGNYRKLPKHSPLPLQEESSHVYQGFFDRRDPGRANTRSGETPAPSSRSGIQTRTRADRGRRKTTSGVGSGGLNGDPSSHKGSGRSCLVSKKLMELEVLDVGNIQHVLDVEEAFHFYSLLKCPVYRAIADDFFAKIYAELCRDSTADHKEKLTRRNFQSSQRTWKWWVDLGEVEYPPTEELCSHPRMGSRHVLLRSVSLRKDSTIGMMGFLT